MFEVGWVSTSVDVQVIERWNITKVCASSFQPTNLKNVRRLGGEAVDPDVGRDNRRAAALP